MCHFRKHVVGLRHEGRGVEGFTPSVKRKSDFRVGGGGRVKLPCHPRPGPLSRIDRSTEALWARDSFTWGAGEKGDGFKGKSLWDCRFNAVSPINRPPPSYTPLLPSPLSSTRPCFGDALARGQRIDRPTLRSTASPASVENSIFNFNDPGKERKFRGR